MIARLLGLFLTLLSMFIVIKSKLFVNGAEDSTALVLGFMLLSAYSLGYFLKKFGLPLITGYIFAGLMFGPWFFNFYSVKSVVDLGFLNSLALAFIAFCAGGELKYSNIKNKLKSILFLVGGVSIFVFTGVTTAVLLMSNFIPFMADLDFIVKLAISSIFGIIAVARSPSSAIAIISETKAKGEYTDVVLTVSIAMDVVIIVLFALVVSVAEVVVNVGGSLDFMFLLSLIGEILIAIVVGFFLGKGIVFLIDKVNMEFPIVIAAMGFMVIKFCHILGAYLSESHDISLHIEPLLICMAAGYTVQNFSGHGKLFLDRMDRVSLPIYVAFFAITGASINIEILKDGWLIGLVIFIVRTLMIRIGSELSGRLAKDSPRIYKNTWMGFITQAGVSLGLLTEVVRRFPEFGVSIQTILLATITLNQIVGPITFKHALRKTGESKIKA